jgi:hypothetical protein
VFRDVPLACCVVPCSTYGVVLKARHKETGQIVAIKKIKESDKDEKIRQNTVREVRILKVQWWRWCLRWGAAAVVVAAALLLVRG